MSQDRREFMKILKDVVWGLLGVIVLVVCVYCRAVRLAELQGLPTGRDPATGEFQY